MTINELLEKVEDKFYDMGNTFNQFYIKYDCDKCEFEVSDKEMFIEFYTTFIDCALQVEREMRDMYNCLAKNDKYIYISYDSFDAYYKTLNGEKSIESYWKHWEEEL